MDTILDVVGVDGNFGAGRVVALMDNRLVLLLYCVVSVHLNKKYDEGQDEVP